MTRQNILFSSFWRAISFAAVGIVHVIVPCSVTNCPIQAHPFLVMSPSRDEARERNENIACSGVHS